MTKKQQTQIAESYIAELVASYNRGQTSSALLFNLKGKHAAFDSAVVLCDAIGLKLDWDKIESFAKTAII